MLGILDSTIALKVLDHREVPQIYPRNFMLDGHVF